MAEPPIENEVPLVSAADSFGALYERDFVRVVALVYAMSGSRSAAEEIAQDAFVAAHREWDRVRALQDPGGWVRCVALNCARSAWRRRSAEARAMARVGSRRTLPSELPAASADFWAAVRSLPRAQAIAVALHYGEDRSVADVAAVLGVAEGTVKTHLARARRSLTERLRLEDDAEGGSDDELR